MKETWVWSLGWDNPLEKGKATHCSILSWRIPWTIQSMEFSRQNIGVGSLPWGCWGSDTTERLHFHFSLSCIGEGNGNPIQCSGLENPRDGRAWWAAVYAVTQSRTWLKWLSGSSSMIMTTYRLLWVFLGNHQTWWWSWEPPTQGSTRTHLIPFPPWTTQRHVRE